MSNLIVKPSKLNHLMMDNLTETTKDFIASKGINFDNLNKEVQFKIFSKVIKGCRRCDVKKDATIIPSFKEKPKLLVISRSPGRQDILHNRILPIEHPTGALLERYVNILGYSLSEIYLTNVAFCGKKNYSQLTSDCYFRCSLYKKMELSMLEIPDIVLLLGNDALKFMYGQDTPTLTTVFGNIYITEFLGKPRIVIPLYHPVTVIQDQSLLKPISEVLKISKRIIEDKERFLKLYDESRMED